MAKTGTISKTKISTSLGIIFGFGSVSIAVAALALWLGSTSQPTPTRSDVQSMSLTQLHERFLTTADEYFARPEKDRRQLLTALKQSATDRRDRMIRLLARNPQKFLELAILGPLRDALPADTQPFVEEQTTIEGTLILEIQDSFATGKSEAQHFLLPDVGKPEQRVAVFFATEPKRKLINDRLRVRGWVLGGQLASDGSLENLEVVNDAPAITSIVGQRKVAVILFNFSDFPSTPITPEAMRQAIFTDDDSVASYYNEVSFGQLTVTGYQNPSPRADVYGWYTVNSSSIPCNYSIWTAAAGNLAVNDTTLPPDLRFNPNNYDHVIYASPRSSCAFDGQAYMPGGVSYINGMFYLYVIGHELGHNFGLNHANLLNCSQGGGPVPISGTCSSIEYADRFDIMGNYATASLISRHTGVFNKGALEWLNAQETVDVTPTATPQSFTIGPQEYRCSGSDCPPAAKALRIPRDSDEYFYVEYRQPRPSEIFDYRDGNVNGVYIRVAPYEEHKTNLIDTDLTSGAYDLAIGRTLVDPVSGVEVTTTANDATSATITVRLGCGRAAPSVIAGSGSVAYPRPGEPVEFTLTLRNNDSTVCSASTFNVNTSLPMGWVQTPNPLQVTLSPQASTTVPVTIVPSPTAADGNYLLEVYMENTSVPGTSGRGTMLIFLDTTPPALTLGTVPEDISTLPSSGMVTVTVNSEWTARKELFINDRQVLDCDPIYVPCDVYQWSVEGLAPGSYRLLGKATDVAGNIATVSFTAVVPGSGECFDADNNGRIDPGECPPIEIE